VKKGQVLFVIDQASYQAEVKAAEANVAVAKAGLETALLNYDSRKTLYQKNVVSDYDLRTATANLSMAKAQSQQAQAQLQSARTNLSYTVLRSPSDGVVGSLPFRTGSIVIPNELKQVIVIPQSATYEIQDKTYAWRLVHGRSTLGRSSLRPSSACFRSRRRTSRRNIPD